MRVKALLYAFMFVLFVSLWFGWLVGGCLFWCMRRSATYMAMPIGIVGKARNGEGVLLSESRF